MDFVEFIAGTDDNDRRLDKIIRKFCSELTLSSIYKFIRKGLIKVNNKKTTAEYHVLKDDKIQIAAFIIDDLHNSSENVNKSTPRQIESNKQKTNSNLPEIKVIFKNEDFLIINKPYDYAVHGNTNDRKPNLEKIIQDLFPSDAKNSLSFTPGPLHRLDKKTTGLLCFSQSLSGARIFSDELQNHQIQKKYIGIAQGHLNKKEIWIDEISKESDEKKGFHTVKIEKNDTSKTAETEATPLFYGNYNGIPVTIIQYYIKTGRTHQIRSQTSLHGYPLIGDTAYNGKKIYNESREFYLHAAKLIFLNPEKFYTENSNFNGEIICPPDDDFLIFISKTCGKAINLEL